MRYFIDESVAEDPYIINKYFVKSDDGVDNCCVIINGHDHPLRARSSMIVLKMKSDGFMYTYCKHKSNEDDYSFPGGGWNKNETPVHAAERECNEETLFEVRNIKYEGIKIEYHNDKKDVAKWVKDHVHDENLWWYGYYSKIFVGIYDGPFIGHVEEKDREHGYKWYKVSDIIKLIPKEYRDAIVNYINNIRNED